MRAPPEAANMMKGVPLPIAVSRPLTSASPAAMPSEPPMKSKSCTRHHHRQAVEPAEAELDRVIGAGLAARVLEAVDVAALVAELQRIDRHVRDRDVEPGLAVEHRLEARQGAHAHVIVRAGDDELVGLHVLVEHELAGLGHLIQRFSGGSRRLRKAADFWADDVGNPVHVGCFTGIPTIPLFLRALSPVSYSVLRCRLKGLQ